MMRKSTEGPSDLPFQTHRLTSLAGAGTVGRMRACAQERWVYDTLQRQMLADWEMWRAAPQDLFEQISSMRRARIGLLWVSRKLGPSPYHPVTPSNFVRKNPETQVDSIVWTFKFFYRAMPYDEWAARYRLLAREGRQ